MIEWENLKEQREIEVEIHFCVADCEREMSCKQCDQSGQFLNVLGDKILTKVAQMIGNFLGNFEKPHLGM